MARRSRECTWVLETSRVRCLRVLACRASLTPLGSTVAVGAVAKPWVVAMYLARTHAGVLVHATAPKPNLARRLGVGIWTSPLLTFLRTGRIRWQRRE